MFNRVKKTYVIAFCVMSLMASVMGCSSGDLSESATPEGAFKAAEEFEKDERYEEAITKFNEVKNNILTVAMLLRLNSM